MSGFDAVGGPVPALHAAAAAFAQRLPGVDSRWGDPTPCADWDVRALVNHLTAEDLWVPPLLDGATIADVGDRFDGDVLGDDPVGAYHAAMGAALEATQAVDLGQIVHLSFGDVPVSFYLEQLVADHLIHAWDLARAVGGDERLDADLVAACLEWYEGHEDAYRSSGAVGPRPTVPADADAQTRLLAGFGRAA